jgi:hypothetical protein
MSETETVAPPKRKKRRVDPFSRPERWATKTARLDARDGRSREGQLIRAVRDELMAHVGGKPSTVQRMLIERAVMLTVHIGRLDARALEKGSMSPHATREYLAWCNVLRRTLATLGLKGAEATPTSLSDLLE